MTGGGRVLVAAAGLGVIATLLFLVFRSIWTRIRPAAATNVELEERYFLPGDNGSASFSDRIDTAFARFVIGTGLELTPAQATGWLGLAGALGTTVFFVARPEWWMAAFGLAIGVGILFGILGHYYRRHRARLQEQLPEVFHALARSTRAGMSVEQAIEMLAQDTRFGLAAEFRRCHAQIAIGLPVAASLELAARRLDLPDFAALVTLIDFHRTTGGNLPALIDRLATATRERNQFRGYLRTATALGRTAAIGIGLASPVILLCYAVAQPDYAQGFFASTYGWTVTATALGLEIFGLAWLLWLLRIDF
jgi:Flp pilus assembly protein TadB